MPRTTEERDNESAVEQMRQSYSQFIDQIKQGNSFSGKERNCAFLNLGNSKFANVSSISGLDFIDDARGLAVTDWDLDGDVDLIFANRTAPQLRFLQNDYPGGHGFVSFQLVGKSSNRDGVGARVTVTLPDKTSMTKTLRAGSGFLSQSSKRLSFGLGATGQDKIAVRVDWPSGQVQNFPAVEPGHHYRITEEADPLEIVDRQKELATALAPGPIPNAGNPGTVSAVCYPRMRLPVTPVTLENQSPKPLTFRSRYTLVNLWASWCNPCLSELKEFANQYEELKKLDLQIIALSTDGADGKSTTQADAARAATKLALPFPWGTVDRSWLDKLTLLRGELFGLKQPFPMPTSILVDEKGDMRAFYLGVVNVAELKRDMQKLDRQDEAIRNQLTSLSGHWISVPSTIDYLKFASVFKTHGYSEDAAQYDRLAGGQKARQYYNQALQSMEAGQMQMAESQLREAIKLDDSFAPAHLVLGNLLMQLASRSSAGGQKQALDMALREYQKTRELDPENFDALVGLGNVMIQQRQTDQAVEPLEAALVVKPDAWQVRVLLGRLLINNKELGKGVDQRDQAMQSSSENGEVAAAYGSALMQLGRYPQALKVLRTAVDKKPDDPRMARLLADSLLANGDFKSARMRYASALANNRRDVDSMLRLAWIMAVSPDPSLQDPAAALRYSQQAVSAGSNGTAARQTLAAALAAGGQFPRAMQQQAAAMQLIPRQSSQFQAANRRLDLYREGKSYQQSKTDPVPFFPQ
ncbi:MAG: tetratricopeptide repeat protein [Planctomycetota bacterium]|nr:tetratricopeptide repeat protein [Planctomycetota bacterium]